MIYLDVDDVLADFRGACYTKFSRPDPYLDGTFTGWDFIQRWGYTPGYFFGRLDAYFWATLPLLPWAKDVLELCESCDQVCLLTSLPALPSAAGDALEGKMIWIEQHLPKYVSRTVVTRNKELVVRDYYNCLVDDHEANCNNVRRGNGRAIEFPRPWNCNRGEDPILLLKRRLF